MYYRNAPLKCYENLGKEANHFQVHRFEYTISNTCFGTVQRKVYNGIGKLSSSSTNFKEIVYNSIFSSESRPLYSKPKYLNGVKKKRNKNSLSLSNNSITNCKFSKLKFSSRTTRCTLNKYEYFTTWKLSLSLVLIDHCRRRVQFFQNSFQIPPK